MLKKNKACGKSFKSVEEGTEVKKVQTSSEVKCSEVERKEEVKAGCNGKGIYGR
jgi:hypothetical protein